MALIRRLKQAVQWHDGMLLRPEHFQQADRRQDQISHYRLRQLNPHFYGISHLAIDDVMLSGGVLRVTEIEGMMNDGTVFSFFAEDGDLLEVDVNAALKAMDQVPEKIMVHLILPEYRADAASLGSENPRFKSIESDFVVNENTGEEVPRFAVLKPEFKLFVGSEPPKSFLAIPLLDVVNDQGTFRTGSFIAPLMQVPLSSKLGGKMSSALRAIREKISFLAARSKSDTSSSMAQEAVFYIRQMTSGLLGIEARLHSGSAHPFELYVGMCQLAGHLCGLRPSEIPPSFHAYNHEDLEASFKEVIDYINYCLGSLQEGYTVLNFEKQDRVFAMDLTREIVDDKMIIGIKRTADQTQQDLISWVTSAVIASKNYVNSVRDKRILGVKRRIIDGDERLKLVPSSDTILVEITYDRAFIDQTDQLQIFNIGDTPEKRPASVIMYVEKSRVIAQELQ